MGTACPPHGDTGTSPHAPAASHTARASCRPPAQPQPSEPPPAPAPAHSFVLSRCNPTPAAAFGEGAVGDPPAAASRQWGKPKLPKLRAQRVWKMGRQRGGDGGAGVCPVLHARGLWWGQGAAFGGSWHSLPCSVAQSIPWPCPAWSLQVSEFFPEKSGMEAPLPLLPKTTGTHSSHRLGDPGALPALRDGLCPPGSPPHSPGSL